MILYVDFARKRLVLREERRPRWKDKLNCKIQLGVEPPLTEWFQELADPPPDLAHFTPAASTVLGDPRAG